jgi:hypothetical protein
METILEKVQKIFPNAEDYSEDWLVIKIRHDLFLKEFPSGIYMLGTLNEEICRSTEVAEIIGVVRAIKKCNGA